MIDALPYLIFPLFILMWLGISMLLAKSGGWARLAKHYPDTSDAVGTTYRFRSGMIGSVGYRACLKLRISDSGLQLSVMLPFRIGHPPLFIPWDQFHSLYERNYVIVKFLETKVGTPVIATVTLPIWVRKYIEDNSSSSA